MAQHNPLSVHADPLASKKEAWSGRFSEPMAEFVLRYTASVNFDKRMAEADIAGSVAHAKMLAKCGIISKEDLNDIERRMRQILQKSKKTSFEWKLELEDVISTLKPLNGACRKTPESAFTPAAAVMTKLH